VKAAILAMVASREDWSS